MTPTAYVYFILGLSFLVWPLATLLFKRHVLGAQWLMMTALLVMSLAVIVYSTLFNNFLAGEYLLVILFMLLSLVTPPLTYMYVVALTNEKGVSRKARGLILPSLAVMLLMVISVFVGGADMYRLWMQRCADHMANTFFPGSWRYNVIVTIHFYIYSVAVIAESAFVAFYSFVSLSRFRRRLGEYFDANQLRQNNFAKLFFAIGLNCICVIFSYIIYPFNMQRPLYTIIIFALIQAVAGFMIGMYTYMMPLGAEQFPDMHVASKRAVRDLPTIRRQLSDLLEKKQAFLNPDLSVFILAEQLHVSEDQIIDAFHSLYGTTFSEYLDTLRIEHAIQLLTTGTYHIDNPNVEERFAHQCGYLDAKTFEHSFQKVMNVPVTEWSTKS